MWGVVILTAFLCFGLTPVNHTARAATIEIDTLDPVLIMEKVSMEQAVAGGEFTIGLSIRNISSNPGFDLNLTCRIKGEESLEPFALKPNQKTVIDQIEGNETRTVQLTFTVDESAQNKDYEMIINLSGKNAEFKDTVHTTASVIVPVTYDVTKPVLIIRSASVSPANPELIEGFEAHLSIQNLSKTTDAHNIVVLLEENDNFEVLDISNRKNIIKLAKGEDTVVTYKLRAKDTRSGNAVKLKIGYDYLGSKTESVEESINLPLPREDVGVGATPWVIVNKYTLSAERVLAGNTVTLKLFIENTNMRPVKNVKISLGVIKIEESSGPSSSTTTGGTVFSPINSSNSFYLDNIPGKTVIEKDIDLYVDPNAVAKTYIVPVEIKYEDRNGKTLECEEMVNIPVTQECKLNVLSVQVPPVGAVGQPVQVTAEFVNIGKVALGNFMVTLEGDFQKENGTYYVGNLDIGFNDFFQGAVIPSQEGTLEGKLVFSYIDNNNKDVRVEKPFTVEVQNAPAGPAGPAGGMMKPGEPGRPVPGKQASGGGFFATLKNNWLNGLLGILILVEGVYIWRLRRKRNSEEFFNE